MPFNDLDRHDFGPDPAEDPRTRRLIAEALNEDIGAGDATTAALIPRAATFSGVILARKALRVSGAGVAAAVFRAVDNAIKFEILKADGANAEADAALARVTGPAAAILAAERTALNFMQRMCGIATLTARFVDAVRPFGTLILDTRKTTPCLRHLEKYAVRCGGGANHRMGLYDRILIKDNHRALLRPGATLAAAVRAARAAYPNLSVEIEVESEAELRDALAGRPDWVLLDNMPLELLRRCAALCAGVCRTEASGGITLENIREIAATGVTAVSIGALTHSAPAADLTLELEN